MARSALIFLFLASGLALDGISSFAQAPPTPIFENVQVQASCEQNLQCGGYRYAFAVTNPVGNTITLWRVALHLGVEVSDIKDLFGPPDWSTNKRGRDFSPNPEDSPLPPKISWIASDDPFLLLPGGTVAPLGFCVSVPPAVRDAWVYAWLDPWFATYEHSTGEEYDDPAGLERSYIRKISTLAPLSVPPGTFEHWNVFLFDVDKAGTLGWIADAGLLSQIQARLSEARQAALAQDLPTVNAKLDAAIALAEGATPAQMRREAHDLIVLNANYLKAHLPKPYGPKLAPVPPPTSQPVGVPHNKKDVPVNDGQAHDSTK